MFPDLITIRPAEPHDAAGLALVYEEAWRASYQGMLPHAYLRRTIARRGADWWQRALARGQDPLVLIFDGELAGYAYFGRTRNPGLPFEGEIYELYLRPVYQGNGFGRRLFQAARDALAAQGLSGLLVWSLAENCPALAFYDSLGGKRTAQAKEPSGNGAFDKIAFCWPKVR